jgi:hypothetical protein
MVNTNLYLSWGIYAASDDHVAAAGGTVAALFSTVSHRLYEGGAG